MPSCSASLGLLVLLGGVLAYALPFQAISETLKQSHETIATDLGLTQLDVNRDPLFDFVIRTINTSFLFSVSSSASSFLQPPSDN